jgi:hypothetical protein
VPQLITLPDSDAHSAPVQADTVRIAAAKKFLLTVPNPPKKAELGSLSSRPNTLPLGFLILNY